MGDISELEIDLVTCVSKGALPYSCDQTAKS